MKQSIEEKKIEDFTKELGALCVGKDVQIVIGAAFNLIMSSVMIIPERNIVSAVCASFREMANRLEKLSSH